MTHHDKPEGPVFLVSHARRQRINKHKLKNQRQPKNDAIDQQVRQAYALREQQKAALENKTKGLTPAQRYFITKEKAPTKVRYSPRTGRPSSLHGGLAARLRGDTPRARGRKGKRRYNNVYRCVHTGVAAHFALQDKRMVCNSERVARHVRECRS